MKIFFLNRQKSLFDIKVKKQFSKFFKKFILFHTKFMIYISSHIFIIHIIYTVRIKKLDAHTFFNFFSYYLPQNKEKRKNKKY